MIRVEEQEVFKLPVGYVITEDEVALSVLGVVEYLDADGNREFRVFNNEGLHPVVAVGMAGMLQTQCADDLQTSIYMNCTLGDEDDD